MSLLFQLESAKIVQVQEISNYKKKVYPGGGILADEMGLGYLCTFPFFSLLLTFFILGKRQKL
jgi:hypothetical protein